MKAKVDASKKVLLLAVLCLLALLLRLIQIERVPVGITHDELDYYFGGKFIAFTGAGFSSEWKWWQLAPMKTGTLTAELASLFYVPIAGWFPSTLFFAKLTPALFGTLLVIIVFLLMRRVSGSWRVGTIAALMLAINPWGIVYARTGFEVVVALFWYTVALTAFLNYQEPSFASWKRRGLLLLTLVSMGLGYFSYHGFKFLIIPLAGVMGLDWWLRSKQRSGNRREKIVVMGLLVLVAVLLTGYSWVTKNRFESRQQEILTGNMTELAEEVDMKRKLSLWPQMSYWLENKATTVGRHWLESYLDFFSPRRLFFSADDTFNLRLDLHGYFYLIEILFIATGLAVAYKTGRYHLLVLLLLIAPIPSMIHVGKSYGIRSQLAIVPLVGLSAVGINYWWKRLKTTPVRIGLMVVVGMSLAYFYYLYQARYAIVSADQYMIEERLVSSLVNRIGQNTPVVLVDSEPYPVIRAYLFYTDRLKRENAKHWQREFTKQGLWGNYREGNLLVTADCNQIDLTADKVNIVRSGYLVNCMRINPELAEQVNKTGHVAIGSPIDSREYYQVFGASFCDPQTIPRYIHVSSSSKLMVEDLSNDEFCRTWMFAP